MAVGFIDVGHDTAGSFWSEEYLFGGKCRLSMFMVGLFSFFLLTLFHKN